jgi:hypothetical protein
MGGQVPSKIKRRPREPDVCFPEGPPLLSNLEAHARTMQIPCRAGLDGCRFHGARGGGPKGKHNDMYRHALYTKKAIKERRFLRELTREAREMLALRSRGAK